MENNDNFFIKTQEIRSRVCKIYIYGAGLYARNIYYILKREGISIDGFVVTHIEKDEKLYELPIMNVDKVLSNNIGIIIGTNSLNRIDIIDKLKKSGFNMDNVVQGTDYIEKNTTRYDGSPTMQITTRIGCSVNCRYCPQSLLINKYFEYDKKRKSVMSIETFEKCLNKLPLDTRICFCGMAEPFLNPECGKMIKMAHESGRIVELYTTLEGADRKTLEEIIEIPFGYVVLHVADKYGYAHISVTDEYCKLLEFVINYKRKDGSVFINMCNAQAEPDERVAQICSGKYEILTALHDRAGNLENENLLNKNTPEGKVSCSLCGIRLNHNNLLPDGTVLLCDFDYGLKHVLGNLLQQSYEEILSGDEWKRIYRGMTEKVEEDILCRKCSCAVSI